MIKDYLENITRDSERRIRNLKMDEFIHEPHDKKVRRSEANVNEFVDILGLETCYVSTSGGKDSAVLSHLCKTQHEDIKHVMFNTGLEYKETVDLAKSQGAEIIPPKISWEESCEEHGYPIVSKNVSRRLHDIGRTPISTCLALFNPIYGISDKWLHLTDKEFVDFPVSDYCCTEFKKKPSKHLKLNPIIGTRIEESNNRKSAWKKSGCNSYSKDYKHGVSRPISLWTSSDVNQYVSDNNVKLSKIYTQYEAKRTGCKICPYGSQIDGSRFDLLKELEPKAYEHFINNTKLGYILMISDVDIVSDSSYMAEKKKIDEKVKMWHEENCKGRSLEYRVDLALSKFSYEEIMNALCHLNDIRSLNNFDQIKEIMNERNKL